jgi:hypothetical protein
LDQVGPDRYASAFLFATIPSRSSRQAASKELPTLGLEAGHPVQGTHRRGDEPLEALLAPAERAAGLERRLFGTILQYLCLPGAVPLPRPDVE